MPESTITVKLVIDMRPALAAIDGFIAALTDMRDRLEAELESLIPGTDLAEQGDKTSGATPPREVEL